MLRYCEFFFKSRGYGYYSSIPELQIKLGAHDLETFVLTDEGVVIVFQHYRVAGLGDEPDVVLIPYVELRELIDVRFAESTRGSTEKQPPK